MEGSLRKRLATATTSSLSSSMEGMRCRHRCRWQRKALQNGGGRRGVRAGGDSSKGEDGVADGEGSASALPTRWGRLYEKKCLQSKKIEKIPKWEHIYWTMRNEWIVWFVFSLNREKNRVCFHVRSIGFSQIRNWSGNQNIGPNQPVWTGF